MMHILEATILFNSTEGSKARLHENCGGGFKKQPTPYKKVVGKHLMLIFSLNKFNSCVGVK